MISRPYSKHNHASCDYKRYDKYWNCDWARYDLSHFPYFRFGRYSKARKPYTMFEIVLNPRRHRTIYGQSRYRIMTNLYK